MKQQMKLLLVSFAMLAGTISAETVYINGKPVDQKIIDQTINQFKKASPMATSQMANPEFKKHVLESIGMQQAILLEGNKQGLERTVEFKQKLNEIKPILYAQILQSKAIANITDADIQKKYNQMKQDAMNKKQYLVSHILVKDEKTANDIIMKLNKGEDFGKLAKKYSTDKGSQDKKGDLGWSDGSNFVPEFADAMKNLQKGKYTMTPVKSQFGYHIIKVTDIKVGSSTPMEPLAKMKEQIKQEIENDRTRQFFDTLKVRYKVEVK